MTALDDDWERCVQRCMDIQPELRGVCEEFCEQDETEPDYDDRP